MQINKYGVQWEVTAKPIKSDVEITITNGGLAERKRLWEEERRSTNAMELHRKLNELKGCTRCPSAPRRKL